MAKKKPTKPPDFIRATNRNVPAGRGTGFDGASTAPHERELSASQKLARELNGTELVQRRHGDWQEHQVGWRRMQDAYEGGDRYRNASYGPDRMGLPCRNLFRHAREYPDPQRFPNNNYGFAGGLPGESTITPATADGSWPGQIGADPGAIAGDDDYEMRRARTPVPEFVAEAVEIHLAKVYDQEVARTGPEDLLAWWRDVDGRGTPIDDWMRETVAPLLMVNGCLDLCFDHPQAPPGETIVTRADELRLGLDRCVASYILPQNLVWWRCDPAGRYEECLVREYVNPSDRKDVDENGNPIDPVDPQDRGESWRRNYVRYRHWTATESTLYAYDGDDVLAQIPHPYGRVPIVRLIDLKKHRTPNIGKSRYESICEYQREYYNRDSELILSDTLQAHPFLSGAEDFCKADNTLAVGPGYVLPMKKNVETGTYQGWEFVSPSKDPADSLRKNKQDIVDLKDRRAFLLKPSGASGQGGDTTAQSGVSKQMDTQNGHKHLVAIARSLAKNERFLAEYACIVLRARDLTPQEKEQIQVVYPSRFDIFSAAELTDGTTKLQAVLQAAGQAPQIEAMAIRSIVRQLLLGLTDKEYKALDAEIDLTLAAKATIKEQATEMADPGIQDNADDTDGPGSAEQAAGEDPTGQTQQTMVTI